MASKKVDPSAEMYKALLGRARELLFPLGYRKKGNTFCRASGVSTQVVNFQRSQWRVDRTEPVSFTVNLGVYLHLGDDAPKHKVEYECHWRLRIGHLMPDDRDRWWDIGGRHSVETVWKQIQPVFEEAVVPLLDKARTLDGFRAITSKRSATFFVNGKERLGLLNELAEQL